MMYVVETNLLQRSFSDLLPSEKAAVLTLRYSEMFSQGKRNDIQRELEELERGSGTCGSDFHRSNSRDTLGGDYDLTGRQVANYLRVNQLLDCLRLKLDARLTEYLP
jgi:ParB family chromosome partitioning protein